MTTVAIVHPRCRHLGDHRNVRHYCTLNSKKKWTQAGTVGPFEMTLVK
jgi:hypothetical protein